MNGRTLLLEDEFEFKTVPFIVKVEHREMFVNAKTRQARGINMYGSPTGMKNHGKEWVICECIIAKVRPDYPYTIDEEWPENVDKHFRLVVPLEQPEKTRGIIFTKYVSTRERRKEEIDIEALAKKTIGKMKKAYNDREKVRELS